MILILFQILKLVASHSENELRKSILDTNGSCKEKPFTDLVDIISGSIPPNPSVNAFYACDQTMNRIDAPTSVIYFYSCKFSNLGERSNSGGAIFLTTKGGYPNKKFKSIEIYNCLFENCNANIGGAIYFATQQNSRGLNIVNSTFNNNKAISNGGAIYFSAINGTFENCKFSNNAAPNGADIYFNHNSTSICNELLKVQKNKFIHDQSESTSIGSIVFLSWTRNKFNFNNNEIIIQNVNDLYLFDIDNSRAGSLDDTTLLLDSNCISSLELITKSEALTNVINKEKFSVDCLSDDPKDDQTSCPSYTPSDNLIILTDNQEYESDGNKIVYGCNINLKKINADKCLLLVYNCKFLSLSKSTEDDGGAIYIVTYSSTHETSPTPDGDYEIIGCTFDQCGNDNIVSGGAIYYASKQHDRNIKIANCSFNSNSALQGGAIHIDASIGNIENCIFKDNLAIDGSDINIVYPQIESENSDGFIKIQYCSFYFTLSENAEIIDSFVKIYWGNNAKFDFNNNIITASCSTSIGFLGFENKDSFPNPTSETMLFDSICNSSEFKFSTNEQINNIITENAFSNSCNPTTPTNAPINPTTPTNAPVNPTTPTNAPVNPTTPTNAPVNPTTPTNAPVNPTTPTNAPVNPPVDPAECPAKPSGTVDDLSNNPSTYQPSSILYGCSLNIKSRIDSNLHCVSLYSCTFKDLQDSSTEGGGAIYIFTKGKNPSNNIFNYIDHCKFTNCRSTQGGALSISTAQPTRLFNITSCTFESNEATTNGGGAICFKGVYSIIEGCKFINNKANEKGNDIYFKCGETSSNDKQSFTIQNNKFEINVDRSSSIIYLDWIKTSDFAFYSNKVTINNNNNELYFFEFNGLISDVSENTMNISSNCITSLTYVCKTEDLMKDKFTSGFSTDCSNLPTEPINPTTPTNAPINPTTPTNAPINPTTPTNAPVNPTTPTNAPVNPTTPTNPPVNPPVDPAECPAKPSGTVDDLSNNPSTYQPSSILYGCSLNIKSRIDSNLHCVSLYSCTFKDLQDSSTEGGGAIYIFTKGKNPSNNIFNYIDHCKFTNCRSTQGGALSISTAQPTRLFNITSCTFESNEATTNGGGAICFKGVYSIIEGCKFINNKANEKGNDIYFKCGETSSNDKQSFTIQNNKFEINVDRSSSIIYLDWIKTSDFAFYSNKVTINNNNNELYFFEFNGLISDVSENTMNISSNCITSLTYVCKTEDLMKDKFTSGFSTDCSNLPTEPINPTTPTNAPINPTTPTNAPINPTTPTNAPVNPTTPTNAPVNPTTPTNPPVNPPVDPAECPAKPSGTVDDLSNNPSTYQPSSILYGCSLNIKSRIDSNLHCVSLYSCTFKDLQDSSTEGGGAIYIFTKGKNPSNNIFNYIDHCKFTNCRSTQGGALSISTAQPTRLFNITSCTFESNEATTNGGGAICFKGVYSIIEGCKFINNKANEKGNDIYFKCGETSSNDKQSFTIQNNKFEINVDRSSSIIYLDWIKASDFAFYSNEVTINNNNNNELYFFEFNGLISDVSENTMNISSNCITSLTYVCKTEDLMKDKFTSGFSTDCSNLPTEPINPTTPTNAPINPTTPTNAPINPTTPTNPPVNPPVDPAECPAKPSGTVDDLSNNPSTYQPSSILYGCSLNIKSRIDSNLHCVSLYSCTFKDLQDSSTEGGGAIYIFTKGKNPSNNIFNYIDHCKFTNCRSTQGGALSISTAQPTRLFNITSCTFESNEATTNGGGAICFKGVYSIIEGCKFINNKANEKGNDIYFKCGEKSSNDKRGFTIQNNKFEINVDRSSSIIYLDWIKASDFAFYSNEVTINNNNNNELYFFEFNGLISDVSENTMNISSNCITSLTYVCKTEDLMKDKFTSGFSTDCSNLPTEPINPTTPTNAPINPTTPTNPPVNPTTPTNPPVNPTTPTNAPVDPSGCPSKPSGIIDDLSTNPSSYQTNSILYGCNLEINTRINGYGHSLNIYLCTFNEVKSSSEEKGGSIYIFTSGKKGPSKSNISIEYCTFTSCESPYGGAIALETAQISRFFNINHCKFISNKASKEGGAIYFCAVFCTISECEFINNEASEQGSTIYFECKEGSTSSPNPFIIKNNKFEINSQITTPIIHLNWTEKSDFIFNSNEIRISSSNTLYLFTSNGNLTKGSMSYSSNCISPSIDFICDSTNKELHDKLLTGFSGPCEPIIPTDPTTETTSAIDETSVATSISQKTTEPTNAVETTEPEIPTKVPSATPIVDDLIVDDSLDFEGDSIEFTKDGYSVNNIDHSISNKNSDIFLIHPQGDYSLIKINTTSEKPVKTSFVSPKVKDSTAVILKPSDGSDNFGSGEVGVHANSNLKNIVLQKENVPLNIYNNENSKVSISLDSSLKSTSLSLKDLIVNDGAIQMQIPSETKTIEFNSINAYKTDRVEATRNNEQVEIKVNDVKLNKGSQLTITKFNVTNVIKTSSQSKLIVESMVAFDDNSRMELMESSLIDFGSSLIEGIVKEIKLLEPEPESKLQDGEKMISLMCGINFNCSLWKEKFVGNSEYLSAKCIKNNFDDQVCLAASNSANGLDKNVNDKKPLSGGAIAGIVIAVFVVAAAAVIIVLFVFRKKADNNNIDHQSQEIQQEVGNESIEIIQNQKEVADVFIQEDVFGADTMHHSDDPFVKEFEEN
ncbi:hypothetical protein M9Y10_010138 [Tritrichomonas musculus]|uniref:Polymorphic outer membrane protein n=1 Tax=Tritrichomonas musculus TaxID=1915356 RepID=A0ABR2IRC4_9EUKA